MSILKDYIAYARGHVHPKLSEEASQLLIQAYVGKNVHSSTAWLSRIYSWILILFILIPVYRKAGQKRLTPISYHFVGQSMDLLL